MLPEAGRIKKAMQNLTDRAADLGITHAERELALAPRTFARKKRSISKQIDDILTEYSNTRAFWITGLAKDEILEIARAYVLNYAKTHLELIPGDLFVKQLTELLEDWLPSVTNVAARAEVIARTNVSDLYNFARYTMFTSAPMKGWVQAVQYSAVMDSRTTVLCRGLHGKIFTREDLMRTGLLPPNHFNCRSTILPITRLDVGWEDVYIRQQKITQRPAEGF